MKRSAAIRVAHAALVPLSIALLEGCIDKSVPTISTARPPVAVKLSASYARVAGFAGAVPSIVLAASYLRPDGDRIVLAQQTIGAKSGAQQVRLSVDLARCLDDPATAGSTGCPLRVTVTVRDTSAEATDSTEFGPLNAEPGDELTLATPAIERTSADAALVGIPIALRVTGAPANSQVTWDFGDDSSGTGQSVTHAYATPGLYRPGVWVSGSTMSSATSAALAVGTLTGWWVFGEIPGPSGVTFRLRIVQQGTEIAGTWYEQYTDSSPFGGGLPMTEYALAGTVDGRKVTIVQSEQCKRTFTAVIDAGLASMTGPWENGNPSCTGVGPYRFDRDTVNDMRRVTLAARTTPVPAGTTLVLVPTVEVGNERTDRTLIWQTSNPAVATVSASGVVTAIAPGGVTIKASSRVEPTTWASVNLSVTAGARSP